MGTEVFLDLDLRQTLAIKHSIKNMIELKEVQVEELELGLLYPEELKNFDEINYKINRLKRDIEEEKKILNYLNCKITEFYNKERRKKEIEEFAKNLPTLLNQVEENNRNLGEC